MKNPILHWRRLSTLLFTLLMVFAACNHPFEEEEEKEEYDEMAKIMEWEFNRTKDPFSHTIPIEKLVLARELRDQKFSVMESMRAPVPGISWQERGANNVGGRTRVLAFDLRDSLNGYKKVWAGGVSGGLWFTNDITASSPSWIKVNDLMDNLAISSFVQDPSNPLVMYVGTGEGWFNFDAAQGAGIWKSTDGGITFNLLSATSTFYYTQDLLIGRNNDLYASVRKNNTGSGSSGILKSTDGGSSWTAVLTSPTASTNQGGDLELASNGDIYASMGTAYSNGGIYRSDYASNTINTGNAGTWVNITPNTSGVISTPSNYWNRIELACAPSDPNVLYALFQGYGSMNCTSIQQFDVAVNSWTVRTVPTIIDQGSNSNFTRGQAFYDLTASVDPNNAASLYIAGVDALRSDDNGQTWTQMTTWSLYSATGFSWDQLVHADQHVICYSPGSSSRALWGTDGGVYYTTNANISGSGNKPVFTSRNTGYNVTQYYSVAMHPTTANYFLAGAQDNGTHQFTSAGVNNINEVTGGDGGYCYIDQDDPSIQITSYTYNNYSLSTNGGTSFTSKSLNNRGSFINPGDYDSGPNILYSGDDAGYFFRWTNPSSAGALQDKVAVTAFGTSRVSFVKVSPLTSSRVYFGLENGSVVKVDNAYSGTSLAGTVIKTGVGMVSGLAIDPADENHLLVTYSNYGVISVYESLNAQSASPTWTSVEGDLPDMPVRNVLFDPRNSDWAILATELGIWSTNDLNGASTQWNPTNSGLANVRVEMLKYRSSDQTLVAATHGRGLFTAVLPLSATPDINFATGSGSATEASGTAVDCRSYREYPVNLTISNPPTGTATVQVNLQSATALEGVDFDYTTNGTFSPVSHTVQFLDGATDTKTILIRVYDDADVEPAENFVLSYTISGTTNAVAGMGAQTYSFTINDNDQAPVAFSGTSYTIGTDDVYFGNSTTGQPFDATQAAMRTQMLYKASELSAMGITAGNLSSVSFNLSKRSTRPYLDLSIKIGTTTSDYLIDGSVDIVPMVVYKTLSSYNTVDGWNDFVLDQPFAWNGTDNIVVEVCYNNGTASATELGDLGIGYSDGGSSSQGNMFFQRNLACTGSFSSLSYYNYGYKPQVKFTREVTGTVVDHALYSTNTYFGPGSNLYVYNNAGEILMSLKNLGTHDYGCTQVLVDRTGYSATDFWSTFIPDRLMDKTFRVIPSIPNPSGSYEITLYFTEAEVQGWEAATGNIFTNIKMVKTDGPIQNVTPADPNGAGNIYVVTPTIGRLGTNYTLTYTWNSGFSGFGAGIPGTVLPVNVLDFSGVLKNKSVQLSWKTSYESDNKGFYVERSIDAVHFEAIGFVASKGNNPSGFSYSYTDLSMAAGTNYYRLRMVNSENKPQLSKVISINMPAGPALEFGLLKNPVAGSIDLSFNRLPEGPVRFTLIDMHGKIYWTQELNVTGRQFHLPVDAQRFAAGSYLLVAENRGSRYVVKVSRR